MRFHTKRKRDTVRALATELVRSGQRLDAARRDLALIRNVAIDPTGDFGIAPVARRLGVAVDTVWRWCRDRRIPARRRGREWRIDGHVVARLERERPWTVYLGPSRFWRLSTLTKDC